MTQLFSLGAKSFLQAPITAIDTSLLVSAALADLYPVANTGASAVNTPGLDWFKIILENTLGQKEVVYVRTRSSGSATLSGMLRGQEGTTARSYTASNTVVGHRQTAIDVQTCVEAPINASAALALANTAAQQGGLQAQSYTAVTTVGSSTAYVVATLPVQPSLVAGQRYRIKLHTPNGVAPTLVRDGLAAKAFMVYNSAGAKVAPAAGALPTLFDAEYDGVDYVVLNQLPAVPDEPINAQTGTTYTYLTGDKGKLVTHSNAAAIAGTLPQAGASFPAGWWMDVENKGVGTLTITPTTSTLAGAATFVIPSGQGAKIISDGTNYEAVRYGLGGMIHVRDEKTTGTAGGSSSSGDNIRTLNTVVINTIAGASLASNQVTLPAGTYRVWARAPMFNGGSTARARIVNVTDATVTLLGGSNTISASSDFLVMGAFTLSGTKALNLTVYNQNVRATDGLGTASGDGRTEVFSEMIFWRESA